MKIIQNEIKINTDRIKHAKHFSSIKPEKQYNQLYQYASKLNIRKNNFGVDAFDSKEDNFINFGYLGIMLHDEHTIVYLAKNVFLKRMFTKVEIRKALDILKIKPLELSKRKIFISLSDALRLFLYRKDMCVYTDKAPTTLDETLIKEYLGAYYLQFLEIFKDMCDKSHILDIE